MDLFAYSPSYPDEPGHRGTDTSREAAEDMAPKAATLRAKVHDLLQRAGPLTADECAERLGLSILSIRPRLSELARHAMVEDTGERRLNHSGKRAITWRAI